MTDATQPDWDPRAESVLQNQRQAYDKMRQSCPVARTAMVNGRCFATLM